MLRYTTPWLMLLAVSAWAPSSWADVFRFKDGRVISGTIKSESQREIDGATETVWAVEIEPGSFIQIYASSLEPHGREELSEAEAEYLDRVANVPETAEGHYEFAGWCISRSLRDLATAHYLRVLDLDPNHGPARAATDYRKDDTGRWVKVAKVMEGQRGKVRYRGVWRFPEALAIEQAEQEREAQLIAATKDIPRWHTEAASGRGKRQALAIENLQNINDPLSVGVLTELLQGTKKPAAPPALRLLYVRVLAKLQTYDAARGLAHASVKDPDLQVRNAALDRLQDFGRESAISVYLGYLKNKENGLVNRAAEGLGQLSAEEAVLPLIEALVTEHTQTTGGGNTTYSPGSMTFGNKQQVQTLQVKNPSVLGTLAQLTGQNFDYNQEQWLGWYASLHAAPADDLRRDP